MKNKSSLSTDKPVTLKANLPAHRRQLASLLKRAHIKVIDTYQAQLAELYKIEHPEMIRASREEQEKATAHHLKQVAATSPLEHQGNWVFLPWQNTLIHVLPEKQFTKVRTNRNGNLITAQEQEKFYNTSVGIAGLSVGGSIALAIVLEGGARNISIADFDRLELSNMNRILAGVHELDLPKTTIVARRIWEMNPYAQVSVFENGLDEHNLAKFFDGPPAMDVVIDEMDQMHIKQLIREHARKRKVAFVSTADNGDTSVVDVERHDKKKTPFFLGRLGKTSVEKFKAMNKIEIIREITRLMGPENVPGRMQDSLPEIGRTLVSVPQLGGTALMGGAATAMCIRRIAADLPLPSGRAIVSLDEKLVPNYNSPGAKRHRKAKTKAFAKHYGL